MNEYSKTNKKLSITIIATKNKHKASEMFLPASTNDRPSRKPTRQNIKDEIAEVDIYVKLNNNELDIK